MGAPLRVLLDQAPQFHNLLLNLRPSGRTTPWGPRTARTNSEAASRDADPLGSPPPPPRTAPWEGSRVLCCLRGRPHNGQRMQFTPTDKRDSPTTADPPAWEHRHPSHQTHCQTAAPPPPPPPPREARKSARRRTDGAVQTLHKRCNEATHLLDNACTRGGWGWASPCVCFLARRRPVLGQSQACAPAPTGCLMPPWAYIGRGMEGLLHQHNAWSKGSQGFIKCSHRRKTYNSTPRVTSVVSLQGSGQSPVSSSPHDAVSTFS